VESNGIQCHSRVKQAWSDRASATTYTMKHTRRLKELKTFGINGLERTTQWRN